MFLALASAQPLTPTLSPEGRGGVVGTLGAKPAEPTSPLRGEVGPQDRVRGKKAQPEQVSRARTLRHQPTDAEAKLWRLVRNRRIADAKFVRQLPIGPYFADFACREHMLVVELDGGQHSGSQSDVRRTNIMNALGYSVLRFWNNEVLSNPNGVAMAIQMTLSRNPSPDLRFAPATLSPEGRGEAAANIDSE